MKEKRNKIKARKVSFFWNILPRRYLTQKKDNKVPMINKERNKTNDEKSVN